MTTITTKYLGATNNQPSRVKATFGSDSVTVSWPCLDRAVDNHAIAARALAEKLGLHGSWAAGETKDGYAWVNIHGYRITV